VELLHALWTLGEPVLLVHPGLTRQERAALLRRVGVRTLLDATWRDSSGGLKPARGLARVEDDERCLVVIPTSGTSGRPKAVVLSRRAFAASARSSGRNLGWHADDCWLVCLPLAHVGGLSILTRCAIARRCAALSCGTDPGELAQLVEQHRVTLLSLVPTLLSRWLELRPSWRPPRHLRAVLLGGAGASPGLLREAVARGWPLLKTYGLTQACSQVTVQRYGGPGATEPGVGYPLHGTRLRIVDGRIQVQGATLLSGYLSESGTEPPGLQDGWYDTEDLGHLDRAGRLHVLGRGEDLIVTGGENVSPVEVDTVLESCPGVRAACSFGVDDPQWGQLVAAAVVLEPQTAAALRQLRTHIAAQLAPYKRPRLLALLPRLLSTRTGKLDRSATARASRKRLQRL
jgi:O-succinylbenzoic acid--CoA ligase